ncbi:sulfate ABC transporter permease subunit [Acetobacteraceae bacterium KSS12]|uniref:Sulfate ABC transporter permease subunit n=2 Tax=Rhizosaccharibacter radicis TaxID=2782605 RepID=A0ABT1W1I2_9PROT|nr:sulfate ABC transporter permease subunit [Acetobacteraceae bacterium KSS12]
MALGLTLLAWLAAVLFLLLPLASLGTEALRKGLGGVLRALADDDALAAIRLSALVVAVCVPVNTVCGLFAAYALTKYDFPFRGLLLVLIELPLSVSPVVAGLVWVLLFGAHGWFGPWLAAHNIAVVFALPGILLATLFVTFPFVARTVMPVMESQGRAPEEAATMLGAGFGSVFLRVTLPEIRWALLSGVLLCAARALGEFGAVSVVSGHIPGQTETVPLHIETLYNGYDTVGAFSLAAVLALCSGAMVASRTLMDWLRGRRSVAR